MKRRKFISIWDNGIVTTNGTLDETTGEIDCEVADVDNLGSLIEENFEDEDGDEHEVCSACHCHTMKTVMIEGVGKHLNEVSVCSDFDCENGEGNI